MELNNVIPDNYDEKINRRRKKKIFLLIFSMSITSIVLIVSTYAWFVGTGSVSVSTFTLGIDVDDGIQLSLNGSNWESETLALSKDIILGNDSAGVANKGYAGNKNKWPESGLIPISSPGTVDTTNGVLNIYGESSITATLGGYRLMSTKIDNSTAEKDGYLAFDLFIRNGLEDFYTAAYDPLDNEAFYLTTDSSVVVSPNGASAEDYGLANSVRVAFVQVGRVQSNASPGTIVGIGCASSGGVTGLCSSVTPTVWEPNSKLHNSNLITYFGNVCKKKTVGAGDAITYGAACDPIANNNYVNTYVVKQNILSSDHVDIYDGLNGFMVSDSYKIGAIDTFTDDDKNTTGQARPAFFSLAANSVTKIRVYVYLEGQDVDNYDLISNGNSITINFGFTKNQLNLQAS